MSTKIFVNLPIKDLKRSMDFFSKLGYRFNKQFTDDKAACLVISDDIYSMLVTETFFKTFTSKTITNTKISTEVLLALSCDSKSKVDEIVEKAIKAGGVEPREPQKLDFLYSRSFEDLDGHTWEVVWMDPKFIKPE
jgi:predicted lactoylglutathione lyase